MSPRPRTDFCANKPRTKDLFLWKWTLELTNNLFSCKWTPRPRTTPFQDNIPWFLTVVFKIEVSLNFSYNLQQCCEFGMLCCCSKLTLLTCSQAFFSASFFFLSSSSMTAWILALSFSTILRFFIRSVYCKQCFRAYEHNNKDLSHLR